MAIDWHPAIRALIYCVQFDDDPTQSVDHAIRAVVEKSSLGLGREDYREAIANALASMEPLATIIPQGHPEATIRRFLEALLTRL